MRIINIVNCDLRDEYSQAMIDIGNRFGAETVVLENIDKKSYHPTETGMSQIARQVLEKIK